MKMRYVKKVWAVLMLCVSKVRNVFCFKAAEHGFEKTNKNITQDDVIKRIIKQEYLDRQARLKPVVDMLTLCARQGL